MTAYRILTADYLKGIATSGKNYIKNGYGDQNVIGWAAYADVAGTVPVDGTGGSPVLTITQTASSPLRGDGSILLTKDAANRQGNGVSYDFTIDAADQAKVMNVAFDYAIASGTFAGGTDSTTGDLNVYLYDITNVQVIQPSGFKLGGSVIGQFYKHGACQFQTNSNSTSYRLIIHVASTSASAWTVKLDQVSISSQYSALGAPVTDWSDYVPLTGASGTQTLTGRWCRVGPNMLVEARVAFGGSVTGTPSFTLPSGTQIDSSRLTTVTLNQYPKLGDAVLVNNTASTRIPLSVVYASSTTVNFALIAADTSFAQYSVAVLSDSNSPVGFASGGSIRATFTIPIVGWASNVVMSSDADTRVTAAIITGDPASATSGNPIIVPTVVYDSHGSYNAVTGRYTCPSPGLYKIYGALQSASSATTLTIYKNASIATLAGNLDSNGEATFAGSVLCVTGDIIDIRPGGTVDATSMALNIERTSGPSQIAASESIYCKYTKNSGAHTSNGAYQDVASWTKVNDTHSAFNATTGVFTAPISGFYVMQGCIGFSANSSGVRASQALKNGSNIFFGLNNTAPSGAAPAELVFNGATYLSAGDTINMQAYQTAGSSLNYDTATNGSTIQIYKIGQ